MAKKNNPENLGHISTIVEAEERDSSRNSGR
jgi:hypothetical protein